MAYKLSIIFIFSFSCLFFYPNEFIKEKEEVYFQKDKDSILESKYNYCYKLYKSEDYAKALQETLKFLEHVKNQESNEYITSSHILIAKIFSSFNNNEKAIFHFRKALQTIDSKKNIDKLNSINLSFDYAEILLGLGTKYQLIKKIDSAEYFYNKIASLNSLNPKIQSIRAKSYNNLSGIYIDKSDFKTAKDYTEKAIEIHQKTNNKVSEASSLNNLASIYLLEKNYLKAKQTYFEGIRLIEKNDNYKAIKFKKDLYLNIAYILYLEKDYKAYDYQEKSYIIKDKEKGLIRKDIDPKLLSTVLNEFMSKITLEELSKTTSNLETVEQKATEIIEIIMKGICTHV